MTAKRQQIEKKIKVDANIAPLLDFMLKKGSVDLSGISNSFIRVWINQNLDLLSESEKKQFHLI
jgi:hypothetical protein